MDPRAGRGDVAILTAIADAADGAYEDVAIVVPVPQAFADLADSNCDGLDDPSIRVVAHPEQAPEGHRILHLALPPE